MLARREANEPDSLKRYTVVVYYAKTEKDIERRLGYRCTGGFGIASDDDSIVLCLHFSYFLRKQFISEK